MSKNKPTILKAITEVNWIMEDVGKLEDSCLYILTTCPYNVAQEQISISINLLKVVHDSLNLYEKILSQLKNQPMIKNDKKQSAYEFGKNNYNIAGRIEYGSEKTKILSQLKN